MNATEQNFPVVLFIMRHKVGSNFCVAIEKKATEQYCDRCCALLITL